MMTRHRTTQLVTLLVLVAALAIGLARKAGWRAAKAPAEPQDAVYAMLAAARAGDVNAYLACYTGQLQATLRQAVKESTEPSFAKYLRDTHAAVKGVAVSDPKKIGEQEATLRVEYIYEDRNEAQIVSLEKGPAGWKIARAGSADRVPALIPYGTPIKQLPSGFVRRNGGQSCPQPPFKWLFGPPTSVRAPKEPAKSPRQRGPAQD
jgi:hypothetical protein